MVEICHTRHLWRFKASTIKMYFRILKSGEKQQMELTRSAILAYMLTLKMVVLNL